MLVRHRHSWEIWGGQGQTNTSAKRVSAGSLSEPSTFFPSLLYFLTRGFFFRKNPLSWVCRIAEVFPQGLRDMSLFFFFSLFLFLLQMNGSLHPDTGKKLHLRRQKFCKCRKDLIRAVNSIFSAREKHKCGWVNAECPSRAKKTLFLKVQSFRKWLALALYYYCRLI